ncbi:hypothetical protein [Brevibacillus sp. NRS-1366]|uniref:hypothetical protein n=1 Tax=Brevibacillus sp. NRS-1366 TaxID=3233899 RepID=UPI003D1A9594
MVNFQDILSLSDEKKKLVWDIVQDWITTDDQSGELYIHIRNLMENDKYCTWFSQQELQSFLNLFVSDYEEAVPNGREELEEYYQQIKKEIEEENANRTKQEEEKRRMGEMLKEVIIEGERHKEMFNTISNQLNMYPEFLSSDIVVQASYRSLMENFNKLNELTREYYNSSYVFIRLLANNLGIKIPKSDEESVESLLDKIRGQYLQ